MLPPEIAVSVIRSRVWMEGWVIYIQTPSGIEIQMGIILLVDERNKIEEPELYRDTLYYPSKSQVWFSVKLDTRHLQTIATFKPSI